MFKAGLQQDRLFELPLIAGVSAVNVHWSVCSRFTAVMKDSVDDSDATLNIFSLASGHLYERFLRYNTLITMSCYCIRMYSLLLWNSGLCSRHICFLGMPCHHWKTVSEAFCIRSVSVCEWVCSSRKSCECHISKTSDGNFTQFWSQMYLGSWMCWSDFGSKGQRSRSQQAEAITVDGSSLSFM